MKVIHSSYLYKRVGWSSNFHKEYYLNIHEELIRRGHESIIDIDGFYYDDADFTIQADPECIRQGGKGVWIGHALPVVPQNKFYYERSYYDTIHKNCDYIFTYSGEWVKWHEMYNLPTYNVGMPKLDTLFDNIDGGSILFAPTHSRKPNVYSAEKVDVSKLSNYGYDVIERGHPAFTDNQLSLHDSLKKSSIVISDYSSVGLEAITLNIPTILIGDEKWKDVENDHMSGKADEAAIRVYNQTELEEAIEIYKNNPNHLESERLKHSKILCNHQKTSSAKFVDTLERLI